MAWKRTVERTDTSTVEAIADAERRVLADGETALALRNSPIWPFLLAWAEERCNTSLAKLRRCLSSDPAVVAGLAAAWRRDEDWLTGLQVYTLGLIADREALLADVEATKAGLQDDMNFAAVTQPETTED